uniref:Uncharacterized protein n=1 Tax=Dunaliella tertiolecta TaxID=3047 RepID=A0A7S3QLP8_DUNTE
MNQEIKSIEEPPGLARLFQLYEQDRLVIQSVPVPQAPERASAMKEDPNTLRCGSLLFYKGLQDKSSNFRQSNAVARLGDHSQVKQTVFGVLHDLELVWQTHEQLEQAKPVDKQGQPFLFFTNCDMFDVANECGGHACWKYSELQSQVSQPVALQRTRGFNFRAHCESVLENGATKDNPKRPGKECEWNELRASLNRSNTVGVAYISDPSSDPREYIDSARLLLHDLGLPELCCVVFELDNPGSSTGNLLVVEEEREPVEGPAENAQQQHLGDDGGLAARKTAEVEKVASSAAIKEVEGQKGGKGPGTLATCGNCGPGYPAEQACKRLLSYWEYIAEIRSQLAA